MIIIRNSARQENTHYRNYSDSRDNVYPYRKAQTPYRDRGFYSYSNRKNGYTSTQNYGRAPNRYVNATNYRGVKNYGRTPYGYTSRTKSFGHILAKSLITTGSVFVKGCKLLTNTTKNAFQGAKDVKDRFRSNKKVQEDNIYYSEDATFGNVSFSHDDMIKILEIPVTGIIYATETSANFVKKYSNIIIDKFNLEPEDERLKETTFSDDDLCSFDDDTLTMFEKMKD